MSNVQSSPSSETAHDGSIDDAAEAILDRWTDAEEPSEATDLEAATEATEAKTDEQKFEAFKTVYPFIVVVVSLPVNQRKFRKLVSFQVNDGIAKDELTTYP